MARRQASYGMRASICHGWNRWLACLLLVLTVRVWGDEAEGPHPRVVYAETVRAELAAGSYAALEQEADRLRTAKARFPEGTWQLAAFYRGLDPSLHAYTEEDWKAWFDRLDEWNRAYPQSITQPVACAQAWNKYGWSARGEGSASTVKDRGWELFHERLAKARAALDAADKLPVKCLQWYAVMLAVARGQEWERDRYDALFNLAVLVEPSYYDFYYEKAAYLLPRWDGKTTGEWIAFADEAARTDDPGERATLYARIVWSEVGTWQEKYDPRQIDWAKVKQGFADIEKQFARSDWNLNNFCFYACLAGDRETARELFGRIELAHITPNAWGGRKEFDRWQQWAGSANTP